MVPPSAPPTPTSPFPSSNTPQPSSLSRLTLSDKLLLAQAVHHIGSSPPDWGRVSSILLSHPLIRTKGRLEQASKAGITLGRIFGSRECERAWVALMRQYNLVLQPGEKEVLNESESEGSSTLANRAKEARGLPPKTDRGSQLALAQFLYAERIREIQESIKMKEQRFKALVADIEALNTGALDTKLSAEVTLLNAQAVTPAAEVSSRPPPKDRTSATVQTATTPGGTSRNTRLSRSGSSATAPAPFTTEEGGESGDLTGMDVSNSTEEAQDIDMSITDEPSMGNPEGIESTGAAPEVGDVEMVELEKTDAKENVEARDASNKIPVETEVEDEDLAEKKSGEEPDADDEGEGEVENEEENQQKKSRPRRSRRSGRGVAPEDESQVSVTPASAVTSSTKIRLGALRSRETSGASQDGDEDGEGVEMDTSRSTVERASRTSISPSSNRRGRGSSRLSNNVANRRQSRGGSNTSRVDGDFSEAERDKAERGKAKRKNEKVLMMLLNEVSNHTHGNLFHSAIKEQDAPDYYALIRHPLDLKTIKMRLKEGVIVNSIQLRRALNQMFANSLIYNRPGTEIHRMALEMRDAAEEMIDRFEQTQLSASYARR